MLFRSILLSPILHICLVFDSPEVVEAVDAEAVEVTEDDAEEEGMDDEETMEEATAEDIR